MEIEIFYQLILATLLGGVIGFEGEIKKREAGLQTYSLVALGSCFFTTTALLLAVRGLIADPSSIIVAITIGMGFIGAGSIFRGEKKVEGLTTAAGLWVTAAIGLAVGVKFYFFAIFTTLLVLIIFVGFGLLEEKLLKQKSN